MLRYFFILFFATTTVYSQTLPYKNPALPIDMRVRDLLHRMTTEEKFFQLFMIPGDLNNRTPGQYQHGIFGLQIGAVSKGEGNAQQLLSYNTAEDASAVARKINEIQKFFIEQTRLGIPIIAFDEALHGLVRNGATVFPQSIGLAASFDTMLMRKVSSVIASETKLRGIRQVLSPVINIATDVRWGRVEETYGEDPFLTSAMGVAYVRSFEKKGIITTPKHFIANVGDGGRDSYSIHLNERFLEETHFAPFKACINEGGSRSVMTSYNSVDGTASTSNSWLLNEKLKKEWGFKGFVISDAGATGGSIVLHNTAPDFPTSAQQAVNGGLDVIFQTSYDHYKLFLPGFEHNGIDNSRFDDAVSRVLRAKFELGLFENPYVDENAADSIAKNSHAKEIALQASLESIVLLKNQNHTLPFGDKIKTIAVIGEDAKYVRLGGYSGPGNHPVSLLDGITRRAGNKTHVLYAGGAGIAYEEWKVVAGKFLSHGDTPGLQVEYFTNTALEGTPVKIKSDAEVNFDWTLGSPDSLTGNSFYSMRWSGEIKSPAGGDIMIGLTGNDGFRMFLDDKPVIDNWSKQSYHTPMIKFHFEKERKYKIRIEFFEPTGNAHIRLVWDAEVDHDLKKRKMAEAVDVAKQSDVIVVACGIHEGEFQDRALLSLPGYQEELIQLLASTGKPVVVVLVGGSAITMSIWIDNVSSVVDVWYPGEEGGNAISQVLFGDYNPAGRLPITFPIHEGQVPLVYNHKPTGRGDDYYNLTGYPLFPFGFGLSFTTFAYKNIALDKNDIGKNDSVRLHFTVKNTGDRAGDEVVQLYIRDVLATVARPVLELKGFQRVHLAAGEEKEIVFNINPAMLQMLNDKMENVVEPGEFLLLPGASSRDLRLRQTLRVRNQN